MELAAETDTQITLRFTVKDTGIGIPADRVDFLFTPFTQVDASTSRRYGGTGLGLAISRQLTELMGGRIGVESELGKGTTLWFTVPLEKVPIMGSKPPLLPGNVEGRKILVVDDNETNLNFLSAYLKNWGCIVAAAQSASAALSMLRQAAAAGQPFDLALVDRVMPQMDGEQLGQVIKSDPVLQSMPLILITAAGQSGDASRLKALGFSGYLISPPSPSLLLDTLITVLGENVAEGSGEHGFVTRHSLREDLPPAATRGQRGRLLLAEDNTINQRVALRILEKMNYRVDAVANGLEAIAALQMIPYDAVLMDCLMPEMDGFEATAKIRMDARLQVIPIIALTANAMKEDREKCLASGMNDFLSKPIKASDLEQVLEKWLPRRKP